MSGSCHLDSVEIGVECQIFVIPSFITWGTLKLLQDQVAGASFKRDNFY